MVAPPPWKNPGRVLLLTTLLWLLVGLATFAQSLWLGMASPRFAAWMSLIEWGPWLVFSPLIIHLALLAPITGRSWRWAVPLHLGASLGVALAVNWMTMTASRLWAPQPFGVSVTSARGVTAEPAPAAGLAFNTAIGGPIVFHATASFDGPPPPAFDPPDFLAQPPLAVILFMSARLTLPIYGLIVVGAHAWRHHRIALEREGRARRAEHELVRARLAALQAQLQPHFLFNSLNAISAFIARRPAAAENMVCALSELLRAVLHASERTEISLREELEFARRYLAVHQIRFEETLRVDWRIARGLDGALVPTLLLQPLLENALEHGLGGSGGDVTIGAESDGDRLRLAVTNRSIAASPPAARSGTRLGLRNTRARLEALFGAGYRLELIELADGARAEVELPLRRSEA